MTNVLNFLQSQKMILLILAFSLILCISIPISRVLKRDTEIDNILKKEYADKLCIQYALVATKDGWYPCYNCPTPLIYMYVGEVWKYGKTCNGQAGRYPNGFPAKNLTFLAQFYGTEQLCLIEEKFKIYSYFLLPENQSRTIILLRPPGNKIDR